MINGKQNCNCSSSHAKNEEFRKKSIDLNGAYNGSGRPFIDLIDKLRMIGLDNDISLPTFAVIGDQCSGKTSVLEAISGVQLPRGSGFVTRCPLELKMKRHKNWSAEIQYTNIHGGHLAIEIDQVNNIERHIRDAQIAMTMKTKDFSEDLLSIEVLGPDLPNLSVIDLPGVARMTTESQSICRKIKNLIYKYVKKKNTVILCVIPCNENLDTNESLKIAKEVDPQCQRTLGVLTKPDLVDYKDREERIFLLAKNKHYKLQKGYSVVKCRSQKEIDDGISITEARALEKDFFNMYLFNKIYDYAGVEKLSKKLTAELVQHIKFSFPAVLQQLQNKLKITQLRCQLLSKDPPKSNTEKHIFLVAVANSISRCFEDLSNGIYVCDIPQEYRVYVSLYKLFENLKKIIKRNEPSMSDEKLLTEIRTELNCQRGVELSPSWSFNVCKRFIEVYFDNVKNPVYNTLQQAAGATFAAISFVIKMKTMGYVRLHTALQIEVQKIHTEMLHKCKNEITILLSQEEFPFTMNEEYLNSTTSDTPDMNKQTTASTIEHRIAENLRNYMKVAFSRLMDNIAMTIIYNLLQQFNKELYLSLTNFAKNPSNLALIPQIRVDENERNQLRAKLDRFERGLKEITHFTY